MQCGRISVLLVVLCLALSLPAGAATDLAALYTYEVVYAYPHDPEAFTQGLVFHQGRLYEGTGLYGGSSLREVDLETGQVLRIVSLPQAYFGEGIAIVGSRLYQLTWRENTGFIYDLDTFALVGLFTYPTEGWGLTTDGTYLIMSDGSDRLYFLDPERLELVRYVTVTDDGESVPFLNELEYIAGEIYANVWLTDYVVRIDPRNGQVTGWIDFTGLLEPQLAEEYQVDVLNGIAYDQATGRLFVTGKLWPRLFEVRLKVLQTQKP